MSFALEIKKSDRRHRVSSQQWSVSPTHCSHMEINMLQFPGPVLSFFFHLPSLSRTITDREEFHHEMARKLQKTIPDKWAKAKEKSAEGAEGE